MLETEAGTEDDATGVVLGAGAALVAVDATVALEAGAAEATELAAGGVVLAAAVDVPDAAAAVLATAAAVLATAVVAGATAAEVVAAAAPETEETRPSADAAETGLTTAAMLSTRTNAQNAGTLGCRRRIAYRTAPSSKLTIIGGDPLSLAPEGIVNTWASVAHIPGICLSRFTHVETPNWYEKYCLVRVVLVSQSAPQK